MKKFFLLVLCICSMIVSVSAQQNLKLWYERPASVWTEALPVGNGRLGAVVFGKVGEELIQLNEGTLWSGGPAKTNQNPEALTYLPQIREVLLKEEDYTKANSLAKKMQGSYSQSYLPLADLIIKQNFTDSSISSYYRDLDINNAISTTKFTIDRTTFTRKIFISAPDQVIIVRLTSDKPKALNFFAASKSILHYQNIVAAKDELVMMGKAPSHVDPNYVNGPGKQPI